MKRFPNDARCVELPRGARQLRLGTADPLEYVRQLYQREHKQHRNIYTAEIVRRQAATKHKTNGKTMFVCGKGIYEVEVEKNKLLRKTL